MQPATKNYEITHKEKFQAHEKKTLDLQNIHKKKLRTYKMLTRKYFRPRKDPRGNILDPGNTHEKIFWTQEKPTRKYFGPRKYPRGNILDPGNTHEKIFWAHETPTRKYFGLMKYPQENNLHLQNTHEKNILDAWNTHDGTRPTKFSTLIYLVVQNLKLVFYGKKISRNALASKSKKVKGIFVEGFVLKLSSSAVFPLQDHVLNFF